MLVPIMARAAGIPKPRPKPRAKLDPELLLGRGSPLGPTRMVEVVLTVTVLFLISDSSVDAGWFHRYLGQNHHADHHK